MNQVTEIRIKQAKDHARWALRYACRGLRTGNTRTAEHWIEYADGVLYTLRCLRLSGTPFTENASLHRLRRLLDSRS